MLTYADVRSRMCVLLDKKQQTGADRGTKEGVVVEEEEEAGDTLVREGDAKAVLQVCTAYADVC